MAKQVKSIKEKTPSKYKKKMSRSKLISFRVTPQEKEQIQQKAEKKGKTITDYVLDKINSNDLSNSIHMQDHQDIGYLLYVIREGLNNNSVVTPEVQNAIEQIVQFFLHGKRCYS